MTFHCLPSRHLKPYLRPITGERALACGVTDLASDTWEGEVKRIWGKKLPLTAAGVHALRAEYTRTIEPARALVAETLNLERTLSDLVNQAYGLTPAEIGLMWQTAPPRMPIPPPATSLERER